MDRLSFKPGELKTFIEQIQHKLKGGPNEIARLVGLSGRTIRDWKREKFKPTKKHMRYMVFWEIKKLVAEGEKCRGTEEKTIRSYGQSTRRALSNRKNLRIWQNLSESC